MIQKKTILRLLHCYMWRQGRGRMKRVVHDTYIYYLFLTYYLVFQLLHLHTQEEKNETTTKKNKCLPFSSRAIQHYAATITQFSILAIHTCTIPCFSPILLFHYQTSNKKYHLRLLHAQSIVYKQNKFFYFLFQQ